jgi:hypothetical protein
MRMVRIMPKRALRPKHLSKSKSYDIITELNNEVLKVVPKQANIWDGGTLLVPHDVTMTYDLD